MIDAALRGFHIKTTTMAEPKLNFKSLCHLYQE